MPNFFFIIELICNELCNEHRNEAAYDVGVAIHFKVPRQWVLYDRDAVFQPLVKAKASVAAQSGLAG